jgi:hypothetical protein
MRQKMNKINFDEKLDYFLAMAVAAETERDWVEAERYLRLAILCETRLRENVSTATNINKAMSVRLLGKTVY